MSRDKQTQKMVANYKRKRDLSGEVSVMEFHRRHLVLFMNRFLQLAAHFSTPTSAMLGHELFLAVDAATSVARDDWEKHGNTGDQLSKQFAEYFTAFDQLRSGTIALGEGAARCINALQGGRSEDVTS